MLPKHSMIPQGLIDYLYASEFTKNGCIYHMATLFTYFSCKTEKKMFKEWAISFSLTTLYHYLKVLRLRGQIIQSQLEVWIHLVMFGRNKLTQIRNFLILCQCYDYCNSFSIIHSLNDKNTSISNHYLRWTMKVH